MTERATVWGHVLDLLRPDGPDESSPSPSPSPAGVTPRRAGRASRRGGTFESREGERARTYTCGVSLPPTSRGPGRVSRVTGSRLREPPPRPAGRIDVF